jgi:hypothetical protein
MSASTTRLSLTKPGGGSTGLITPADVVDIDVLNANFDKIDAAIGAQVVTSTTLPSTPFAGEFVFESDTKRIRVYQGGSFVAPATERGSLTIYSTATIAALDAIADAQIGDLAYMSDPGNGNAGTTTIDSMLWEATSGAGTATRWRAVDVVVADTVAHLNTFIAAVAATDLIFRPAGMARALDTALFYYFTTFAGAYVPAFAYLGNTVAENTQFPADVNTAASGTTLDTITLPSLPFATTVYGRSSAHAGFNGGAITNGLAVTTSAGTLTQMTLGTVTSAAGAFCEVLQEWKLVIPANTAATVTVKSASSAASFWRSANYYRRVTS